MTANISSYRAGLSAGRFWRYILPLLLWMGFIFALSTNAGSSQVTTGPLLAVLAWLWPDVGQLSPDQKWLLVFLLRKACHVIEYAVLTLLVVRAVQQDNPIWSRRTAVVAVIFVVLHALVDEWHQTWVPSRSGDLRDVVVDTFGGVLALTIAWLWYRGRRDVAVQWERLAQLRRDGFLTEEEFRAAKAQLIGRGLSVETCRRQ